MSGPDQFNGSTVEYTNALIICLRAKKIPIGSLVPISRLGRSGKVGGERIGVSPRSDGSLILPSRSAFSASRNVRWNAPPDKPSPIA